MALPSIPQLKVDVAFADDAFTASPTWTDISSTVRIVEGVDVRRGKQSEVDTTAAGTIRLVLDNRDRRYDPTFTTGPYYGNLKPRKQIRVRALWNGTYYPVFRGFVDGWPQQYRYNRDAWCEITAYDGLAVMSQSEIDGVAYEYLDNVIGSLSYYLFSAFNETWWSKKHISGLSTLTQLNATLKSGAFTIDDLAVADGDGIYFDGATEYTFLTDSPSSTDWCLSFWLQTESAGSGVFPTMMTIAESNTSPVTFECGIDSRGFIGFVSGTAQARTEIPVNTGNPLFITLMMDGTDPYVFVNGVDRTSGNDKFTGTGTADIRRLGNGTKFFTGTLQSVSLVQTAMTSAEILKLYRLSVLDLVSEPTADRVGLILDLAKWPAAQRDLTTHSQVNVEAIPASSFTALAALQTLSDTEQGRMFVTRDGKVAFQDRFWHLTSTRGSTVQATFSDDGTGVPFSDLSFDYSDREIANRVIVNGDGDLTAMVEDSTSADAYGTQVLTVSTYLGSYDEVASAASGILSRYVEPVLKADAMLVKPARNTANWGTVLGLELGDRITVKITPKGVAPERSQTMLIDRLDWTIGEADWQLSITGSLVPDEDYWILGTSQLGTSTVLGW